MNKSIKNALYLGVLCSVAYLSVYYVRGILGIVTPHMLNEGFSSEYIGRVSSAFFITYAAGQFINGIAGDKIKAKYMISFGLILAGVANILFPYLSLGSPFGALAAYGMSGFFLSMIYPPMTRVVSENVESSYVARCSLGYTFAAYIASPLVGIAANIMIWQGVFISGSIALFIMGALCFFFFAIFERRGIVKYSAYQTKEKSVGGIKLLMEHSIVKFTLVSVLTGVIRTTVVFWMPTYINQYLNFTAEEAATIYTVCTFAISASPFVAVFLYEVFKRNMDKTLLISFVVSAFSFLMLYFVNSTYINITLLVLGVFAANSAATVLWSIYCPSLKDTGMISSATGFLDCVSYIAAAVSSTVFANAVSQIGWRNLVLIWFGLMAIGVFISRPDKKIPDA